MIGIEFDKKTLLAEFERQKLVRKIWAKNILLAEFNRTQ